MLDFSYFANGLPQDVRQAVRCWGQAGSGPWLRRREPLGVPGAVGTAGGRSPPGRGLFLWRNREKNTKGKEVPSPWNPILWWEERGKVVPSGRGLACGLQDQRLMARPPARAGRRGWFVDRRKKWETEWFFSSFSQRVPSHVPSPPSRWAGRYEPFTVRAAGQVSRKRYSLPTPPHQRRGSRGRNLLPRGFFPPFLPKKWGPGWASHRSRPFQRRGDKTQNTRPRESNPPGRVPTQQGQWINIRMSLPLNFL